MGSIELSPHPPATTSSSSAPGSLGRPSDPRSSVGPHWEFSALSPSLSRFSASLTLSISGFVPSSLTRRQRRGESASKRGSTCRPCVLVPERYLRVYSVEYNTHTHKTRTHTRSGSSSIHKTTTFYMYIHIYIYTHTMYMYIYAIYLYMSYIQTCFYILCVCVYVFICSLYMYGYSIYVGVCVCVCVHRVDGVQGSLYYIHIGATRQLHASVYHPSRNYAVQRPRRYRRCRTPSSSSNRHYVIHGTDSRSEIEHADGFVFTFVYVFVLVSVTFSPRSIRGSGTFGTVVQKRVGPASSWQFFIYARTSTELYCFECRRTATTLVDFRGI